MVLGFFPVFGCHFLLRHFVASSVKHSQWNGLFIVIAPRSQSYGGGRDQGESPPTFLSAAAATGSPIITPGGGFPQQMYGPIPPPQPVTYVQPHAGMVPQPMLPQVGSEGGFDLFSFILNFVPWNSANVTTGRQWRWFWFVLIYFKFCSMKFHEKVILQVVFINPLSDQLR